MSTPLVTPSALLIKFEVFKKIEVNNDRTLGEHGYDLTKLI